MHTLYLAGGPAPGPGWPQTLLPGGPAYVSYKVYVHRYIDTYMLSVFYYLLGSDSMCVILGIPGKTKCKASHILQRVLEKGASAVFLPKPMKPKTGN